jgi:hypothetical protein
MDLQPLTVGVVDTELKSFLDSWANVSNLSSITRFAPSTSTSPLISTMPASREQSNSELLLAATTAISQVPIGSDEYADAMAGMKAACKAVALVALKKRADAIYAAPVQVAVDHLFETLSDTELSKIMASVTPRGFDRFLQAVKDRVQAICLETMRNDVALRNLVFPTPASAVFLVQVPMNPWLKTWYIGNIRTSFYDRRYGYLMVMQCYIDGMHDLIGMLGTTSPEVKNALRKRYETATTKRASLAMTETSGEVMKTMYRSVQEKSALARAAVSNIQTTGAAMKERMERADTINVNAARETARMKASRLRFSMWLAAYVVAVAIAIALILMGRYSAFMMQAGVVITVVTLYLMIDVLRGVVNRLTR